MLANDVNVIALKNIEYKLLERILFCKMLRKISVRNSV